MTAVQKLLDKPRVTRYISDVTPTSHPNFTGDQEAAFVVAHYGDTHGLMIVVLSTTRSHGRGPSRARPLPGPTTLSELSGADLDDLGGALGIPRHPAPAYPRREVSIIDGTEFAAAGGGRFLAFAGRCYGPGTPEQERHTVRAVVGGLARMFSPQPVVDTTATEVR